MGSLATSGQAPVVLPFPPPQPPTRGIFAAATLLRHVKAKPAPAEADGGSGWAGVAAVPARGRLDGASVPLCATPPPLVARLPALDAVVLPPGRSGREEWSAGALVEVLGGGRVDARDSDAHAPVAAYLLAHVELARGGRARGAAALLDDGDGAGVLALAALEAPARLRPRRAASRAGALAALLALAAPVRLPRDTVDILVGHPSLADRAAGELRAGAAGRVRLLTPGPRGDPPSRPPPGLARAVLGLLRPARVAVTRAELRLGWRVEEGGGGARAVERVPAPPRPALARPPGLAAALAPSPAAPARPAQELRRPPARRRTRGDRLGVFASAPPPPTKAAAAAWHAELGREVPPAATAAAAAALASAPPRSAAAPNGAARPTARAPPDAVDARPDAAVLTVLHVLARDAGAAAEAAAAAGAAHPGGGLLAHAAATAAARHPSPHSASPALLSLALARRLAADACRYGPRAASRRADGAARAAPAAAARLTASLAALRAAAAAAGEADAGPVSAPVRDVLRAEAAASPRARVLLLAERAAFPALIQAAAAARSAVVQVEVIDTMASLLPGGGALLVDRAAAASVPRAALSSLAALVDVAPLPGDGAGDASARLLDDAPLGVRRVVVRVAGVPEGEEGEVAPVASPPPPSPPPATFVLCVGPASALTGRRSLYESLLRLEAGGAAAVERARAAGADAALPGDAALAIWLSPPGMGAAAAPGALREWAMAKLGGLAAAYDRVALIAEAPPGGAPALATALPALSAAAAAAGLILAPMLSAGEAETAALAAGAARGALAARAEGPAPADAPGAVEALLAALPGASPATAAMAAAAAASAGGLAAWLASGTVVPGLSPRRAALLAASLGAGGGGVAAGDDDWVGGGGGGHPAPPPTRAAAAPSSSPPRWGGDAPAAPTFDRDASLSPPWWERHASAPRPASPEAASGWGSHARAPAPRPPSRSPPRWERPPQSPAPSRWDARPPPPRRLASPPPSPTGSPAWSGADTAPLRPPPPGADLGVTAALDRWAARGGARAPPAAAAAAPRKRALAAPTASGPLSAVAGRVRARPADYVAPALGLERPAEGGDQARLAWRRRG